MSAASPTRPVEGSGLTDKVAFLDVTATTARPALRGAMHAIARRLARCFELSCVEPDWTAWREVDALDRAPRL